MIIDYKTHKLTFGKHLPDEPEDFELPLRLHRLATVRGTVDGTHPANFVVDTGGEVISISTRRPWRSASGAGAQNPLKRLRHVRLGPRRVPDARRQPGVRRRSATRTFPVVVLNLEAPSALLGFQVGGHRRPQVPEQVPRRHRPGTLAYSGSKQI